MTVRAAQKLLQQICYSAGSQTHMSGAASIFLFVGFLVSARKTSCCVQLPYGHPIALHFS